MSRKQINFSMLVTNLKQNFFVFLGAIALLLALGAMTQTNSAKIAETAAAQSADKYLAGFAWSDNIGWISFSCANDNTCDGVRNYAVKISASTGNFSGWAWSDNIGWISFNEISGCPEPGCSTRPNLNKTTGAVTGWARALSFGGGWDGWIKLGGSWPESASLYQGQSFIGYSWGDEVVGWIKWDAMTPPGESPPPPGGFPPGGGPPTSGPCPEGGVCICQIDASGECRVIIPENEPPMAVISSPDSSVQVTENSVVRFDSEGSSDPDGDRLTDYEWRENDCTGGLLLSSSKQFTTKFAVGLHQVFLRVKDERNAWSTNCPLVTIAVEVPLPINGACGPANGKTVLNEPTSGLCSVGVASEVSGDGPWTWSCSGDEGGTAAYCSSYNSCGNGTCDQGKGENPASCRQDCPLDVKEF